MGDHVNTKKNTAKRHKAGFSEGQDIAVQRRNRVSFKSYLNDLEDDLLEQELSSTEWVVVRCTKDFDDRWEHEVETFADEDEANEYAKKCREDEDDSNVKYEVREV